MPWTRWRSAGAGLASALVAAGSLLTVQAPSVAAPVAVALDDVTLSTPFPQVGQPVGVQVRVVNLAQERVGPVEVSLELPPGWRFVGNPGPRRVALAASSAFSAATAVASWRAVPERPGVATLTVRVAAGPPNTATFPVLPAPVPPGNLATTAAQGLLRTPDVAVRLVTQGGRAVGALLYVKKAGAYVPVGSLAPLAELVAGEGAGTAQMDLMPNTVARLPGVGAGWRLSGTQVDAEGRRWSYSVEIAAQSADRLALTYRLRVDRPARLLAFHGPTVLVGIPGQGTRKEEGIFPGLDYLNAGDASSSTQVALPPYNLHVVPDPHEVTVPVMAVKVAGATVALGWRPLQAWDPVGSWGPTAVYAVPNTWQGQADSLLGLFLPSVPGWVPDNADRATTPYRITPKLPLALHATLTVSPGASLLRLVARRFVEAGGTEPVPFPRPDYQEWPLIQQAYTKTNWVPGMGWHAFLPNGSVGPFQGSAAWALLTALLAPGSPGSPAVRQVVSAAQRMLVGQGGVANLAGPGPTAFPPGGMALPFLVGHLGQALERVQQEAQSLMASQRPNGSWPYPEPGVSRTDVTPPLGQPGETSLGITAGQAQQVLAWARLSGDEAALAAGEKALRYVAAHLHVPRGAQTWEVPLHAPDVLAAAYGVVAYLEDYEATGDPRDLAEARRWALTGLPFVYAWQAPDVPIMRGVSIPVFGASDYTWPWFGRGVQWNGLDYAYALLLLARADRTFPWAEVAHNLIAAAEQEQFDVQQLAGTYPDSYSEYTGVAQQGYANPLLLPDLLAMDLEMLHGVNTGTATTRALLPGGGRILCTALAPPVVAVARGEVTVQVTLPARVPVRAVVAGLPGRVTSVDVDGEPLASRASLGTGPGYRMQDGLLLLSAPRAGTAVFTVRYRR